MNACKRHYCKEGDHREILLVIFTRLPWVVGNEVIVKNVNANVPVSLSWFLLPFLAFLYFPASTQFIDSSL